VIEIILLTALFCRILCLETFIVFFHFVFFMMVVNLKLIWYKEPYNLALFCCKLVKNEAGSVHKSRNS